jgi:hypothetical protein
MNHFTCELQVVFKDIFLYSILVGFMFDGHDGYCILFLRFFAFIIQLVSILVVCENLYDEYILTYEYPCYADSITLYNIDWAMSLH